MRYFVACGYINQHHYASVIQFGKKRSDEMLIRVGRFKLLIGDEFTNGFERDDDIEGFVYYLLQHAHVVEVVDFIGYKPIFELFVCE